MCVCENILQKHNDFVTELKSVSKAQPVKTETKIQDIFETYDTDLWKYYAAFATHQKQKCSKILERNSKKIRDIKKLQLFHLGSHYSYDS